MFNCAEFAEMASLAKESVWSGGSSIHYLLLNSSHSRDNGKLRKLTNTKGFCTIGIRAAIMLQSSSTLIASAPVGLGGYRVACV